MNNNNTFDKSATEIMEGHVETAGSSVTDRPSSLFETAKKKIGGALVVLFGILAKAKVLLTFGTALLSALFYGFIFGLPFGVGIVVILLIHEFGHVVALRMKGIAASLPVFIPFLGAAIAMKENPRSVADEAFIGGAGPLTGLIASVVCFGVYELTGSQLFAALAYFGFFLQAFNLIPVSPLDGGRMMAAVDRRFWWIGLIIFGAVIIYNLSPFSIIIGVIIAVEFLATRNAPHPADYYSIPTKTKIITMLTWLGMLAASLFGMGLLPVIASK